MTLRRGLAASQIAMGALALARPQLVARAAAGLGAPPPSWIVRVLGGRMIVQGAAIGLRPSERALTVGGAVDVLHGMSMLALAGVSGRQRAAAVRSAIVALVFAGWELAARP
jgi:hypothetical protein